MPKIIRIKVGISRLHEEAKKSYSIKATETGWQGLKRLAACSGLILSEYLKFLGRTYTLPN